MLTTTGSATRSGLVVTAEILPVVLFGVPSGGWAQRLGARRTMLVADAIRGTLVALVPALYWLGGLPFWALLAIVFATGVVVTPYPAAQQILLAEVSGADERTLTRATSMLHSATRIALLLGPPASGVLIVLIGAPAVLVVDAASFVAVLPLIVSMPRPAPVGEPEPPTGLLDGVTVVWADPLLRTWTAASVFSEAAYQAVFVAFPVVTIVRYHASAALAGSLVAAFGGGAVAGSMLAARLAVRVGGRWFAVAGKFVQAAAFTALVPAWPPAGLLAVSVVLGLGNGLTNGPVAVIRLLRLTPGQRPKALTAIGTVTWLGGIVGLVGAGPILDASSATVMFAGLTVLVWTSVGVFVAGARCSGPPQSIGMIAARRRGNGRYWVA